MVGRGTLSCNTGLGGDVHLIDTTSRPNLTPPPAVVSDPNGYTIELHETADLKSERAIKSLVYSVTDLEEAVEFYTEKMGMTLHRKRSLLPLEPAIAAFLSYGDSEEAGTLLELRYNFGMKKIDVGPYGCQVAIASSDVAKAVDMVGKDQVVLEQGEQEGVGSDVATVDGESWC